MFIMNLLIFHGCNSAPSKVLIIHLETCCRSGNNVEITVLTYPLLNLTENEFLIIIILEKIIAAIRCSLALAQTSRIKVSSSLVSEEHFQYFFETITQSKAKLRMQYARIVMFGPRSSLTPTGTWFEGMDR